MLDVSGDSSNVSVGRRQPGSAEPIGVGDGAALAQVVPYRIRILDISRIEDVVVSGRVDGSEVALILTPGPPATILAIRSVQPPERLCTDRVQLTSGRPVIPGKAAPEPEPARGGVDRSREAADGSGHRHPSPAGALFQERPVNYRLIHHYFDSKADLFRRHRRDPRRVLARRRTSGSFPATPITNIRICVLMGRPGAPEQRLRARPARPLSVADAPRDLQPPIPPNISLVAVFPVCGRWPGMNIRCPLFGVGVKSCCGVSACDQSWLRGRPGFTRDVSGMPNRLPLCG